MIASQQRVIANHPIEPARLQRRVHRRQTNAPPELGECRLGPFATAPHIALGEDRRVHRAGAGRGDPLDVDPLVFKQAIEHAPGESAMGAPPPCSARLIVLAPTCLVGDFRPRGVALDTREIPMSTGVRLPPSGNSSSFCLCFGGAHE
jgi:hypothetical protein